MLYLGELRPAIFEGVKVIEANSLQKTEKMTQWLRFVPVETGVCPRLRLFAAHRWGDLGDGHISARDPEKTDRRAVFLTTRPGFLIWYWLALTAVWLKEKAPSISLILYSPPYFGSTTGFGQRGACPHWLGVAVFCGG